MATIAVLAGMIFFLHSKPATRTGGWFHRVFTPLGDTDNAVDAMSSIVVGTTTIVSWLVCLCGVRYGRGTTVPRSPAHGFCWCSR